MPESVAEAQPRRRWRRAASNLKLSLSVSVEPVATARGRGPLRRATVPLRLLEPTR